MKYDLTKDKDVQILGREISDILLKNKWKLIGEHLNLQDNENAGIFTLLLIYIDSLSFKSTLQGILLNAELSNDNEINTKMKIDYLDKVFNKMKEEILVTIKDAETILKQYTD